MCHKKGDRTDLAASNSRGSLSHLRQRMKGLRGQRCWDARKLYNKGTFYLLLWVLWVIAGTLYYSFENDLGLPIGFYQAVNIGYSIGYGYPREPMEQNWWFSSAYVVLGASFVGVALGFFADKIVEDSQDWFMHMIEKQKYEMDTAPDKPFLTRARAFVKFNWAPIRSILLWLVWVAIMIMYSMISIKWPFSAAQYFAVSSCSTGGHMSIPDDSPEWLFGLTGFFSAVGVPLMGVAMGSLGSLLMERRDDVDETKKIIEADVTAKELIELQRFGLENGDGEVDRAEYIILCMVRLGTDPRLVQFISKEFQKLDDDNSNSLSILEITKGRVSCEDLQELGRSQAYMSKRRLSGKKDSITLSVSNGMQQSPSNLSLSSVFEEDKENPRSTAMAGDSLGWKNKPSNENDTAETEYEHSPGVDYFEDNATPSDDNEEGIFF